MTACYLCGKPLSGKVGWFYLTDDHGNALGDHVPVHLGRHKFSTWARAGYDDTWNGFMLPIVGEGYPDHPNPVIDIQELT